MNPGSDGTTQETSRARNILRILFEVCNRTPETRHWLPTREAKFLTLIDPERQVPKNLIIRMSAHMINQGPVKSWPWTSTVLTDGNHSCPASKQNNECKDCRACWDRDISNISYGKH